MSDIDREVRGNKVRYFADNTRVNNLIEFKKDKEKIAKTFKYIHRQRRTSWNSVKKNFNK